MTTREERSRWLVSLLRLALAEDRSKRLELHTVLERAVEYGQSAADKPTVAEFALMMAESAPQRRRIRDGYTGAALRYYDERRAELVLKYGEDRIAEWESVVEGLLVSRTGHLPPLEVLLLMSDAFGQGEFHENQRHARLEAGETGIYTVELPITEAGHYRVWYEIEGPGRLRVSRVERTK